MPLAVAFVVAMATSPADQLRLKLHAFLTATFTNFDAVIRGFPRPAPGPENYVIRKTVWKDCDVVEAGPDRILNCYWFHKTPSKAADADGVLQQFRAAATVLSRELPGYDAARERCEKRNLLGIKTTYQRAGSPSVALRGLASVGGYAITLLVAPYGHPLRLPSAMKPPPCW